MAPPSWYSRWDGSQRLDDLDADQLLEAMSDDILSDGDPWSALRRLFQRGARNPDGANLPGLQDLLSRLRRQRQRQLDRYDLSSVLDDIKQKLDKILQTEREGIERRVADATERAQKGDAPESFREAMQRAAAEHKKTLDEMPESPAGRIQSLQSYEFMDPDAHRLFWELMKGLQQQMLQPFLSNMQKALGNMTPQDLERMREMMRDLNRMLQDRAEGREPDFEAFKQKWGDHFPGAENLDQLMEQIGQPERSDPVPAVEHVARPAPPAPGHDAVPVHAGRAPGGGAAPARHESLPAHAAAGRPPLQLPGRRRPHHEAGHGADGRASPARRSGAADPEGTRSQRPGEDRPAAGRAAPGRRGQAGPRASPRDDQEARGGRLPRAKGRPPRADRAGHPQDRGQGAEGHLRAPQARPLRRPRHRAAGRGRRPHRPVQALRVRRSRSCSSCARP